MILPLTLITLIIGQVKAWESPQIPIDPNQKVQTLASIDKICGFTKLNFVVSIVNYVKKKKESYYCMGVIVTKIWILTAASCVQNRSINSNRTEVAYGVPYQFIKNNKSRIKVQSGSRHPYFDPDSVQHSSHNVGLLKLATELDLETNFQSAVYFQKGRYFVQRCLTAIVPMWRKSNVERKFKQKKKSGNIIRSELGDLECLRSEISSSVRCEGYDDVTVDIPNSFCTHNEENIMHHADIGAPLICEGRTRPVIIGILSLAEDDKSAVYTRLDKYFKFISVETGIKVPFMSEPILSASINRSNNIHIYILLLLFLLFY